MRPFIALFKHSPRTASLAVAYSAAQALFQVGILHAFKPVREGTGDTFSVVLFLVCFVLFYLSKKESHRLFAGLMSGFIARTRLEAMDTIRAASLEDVEKTGTSQILSVLGGDLRQISFLGRILFTVFSMSVSFIFLAAYLLYMSVGMGLFFTGFVGVLIAGLLFHSLIINPKDKHIESYNQFAASYASALDNLLKGLKELKINPLKMGKALQNHDRNSLGLKESGQKKTGAWAQSRILFFDGYYAFTVVTAILLLFLYSADAPNMLAEILIPVFFMADIIYRPLGSFNELSELYNLFGKVGKLREKLEEHKKNAGKNSKKASQIPLVFQEKIVFEDLAHTFRDPEGRQAFQMGPINLSITKGETIFIVGGNGSGKSTLLKTMTGLYPWEGKIEVDGTAINENLLKPYQSLFGAIFTDFHIFGQMYGKAFKRGRADKLLGIFNLSDKTKPLKGGFSETQLSSGQRKRLALISVFANEKEVYIFDEVAADQDPEHRKFFYEFILSDIKKAGKTAIVVSHDDHYFHVADRVLYMESGLFAPDAGSPKEETI